MIRPGLILAAVVLLAGQALAGASGLVVDSRFFPLPGARVCLVEGQSSGPCVLTDGGGEYTLPESDMTAVRITLDGFLPAVVPAVDHVKPILLQRPASLLLFAVDGDGGRLSVGEFWVDSTGGGRIGPFPVNHEGTRVRSLRPGQVAIRVQVPGFRQEEPYWVDLEAGFESRAEIPLVSVTSAR